MAFRFSLLWRGLLVWLIVSAGNFLQAHPQIDSLKCELNQQLDPEFRALNLHRLSRLYRSLHPDSALYFGQQALQQYLLLQSSKGILQSRMTLGKIYYQKGLYQKGVAQFLAILAMKAQTSFINKEGDLFNSLATGYKHIGRKDSALYFYLAAIQEAEADEDSLSLARILVNVGSFYQEVGDLSKSQSYLARGIHLLRLQKRDRLLGMAYLNRGVTYFHQQQSDLALHDFSQALGLFKRLNEEQLLLQASGNMALVYVMQRKVHLAEQILHQGIQQELEKEYPDFQILIGFSGALGAALWEQSEYEKAISWYRESLHYCHHIDALRQKSSLAEMLSMAFEKTYQNDSALHYYKQFVQLKDSLFDQVQTRKIAELEDTYEAEKKEQIIQLQAAKMKATQLKLYLSWGIATLLILLAMVGFLALYQRHRRIKAEAEAQRTRVIELLQDKELDWLNAIVEGQEQERQRLGRELHDQMGSNLSALKLNVHHLKQEASLRHHIAHIEQIIDQTVQSVRRLSHSMEGGILKEFGLQQSLKELCQILEAGSPFRIHLDVEDVTSMLSYEVELALYRISQEALTNIVKYAEAHEVYILLHEVEGEISLTIEDDGIGFDWMHISSAKSMGISNMQKRAQKLGGVCTIDSSPGQGTSILTHIPLPGSSPQSFNPEISKL